MDIAKQKQTINVLYIFLIISTVLGFVPMISAQIMSIALIIAVLIAAYYYRFRDDEDGLLFNHMTYLIGTIWIGSTFLVLGIFAAGGWLYLQGDHSVIHEAANQIANGVVPSEASLMLLTGQYMQANKSLLIMATATFVGPTILYFIYRVANGYSRAMKGYRIAKPKSWL